MCAGMHSSQVTIGDLREISMYEEMRKMSGPRAALVAVMKCETSLDGLPLFSVHELAAFLGEPVSDLTYDLQELEEQGYVEAVGSRWGLRSRLEFKGVNEQMVPTGGPGHSNLGEILYDMDLVFARIESLCTKYKSLRAELHFGIQATDRIRGVVPKIELKDSGGVVSEERRVMILEALSRAEQIRQPPTLSDLAVITGIEIRILNVELSFLKEGRLIADRNGRWSLVLGAVNEAF